MRLAYLMASQLTRGSVGVPPLHAIQKMLQVFRTLPLPRPRC